VALDPAVNLLLIPTLKLLGAGLVVMAACRLILRMQLSRALVMHSVAAAVVAWLTIVAVGDARRAIGDLTDQRAALKDLTNRTSRESCARFHGDELAVAFFRHVAQRVAPAETYYLFRSQRAINVNIDRCMQFYLLPRRPARDPRLAEWIVFYGAASPELSRLVQGGPAGLEVFDRRALLALGRTDRAH
jgi:hypothetical protein